MNERLPWRQRGIEEIPFRNVSESSLTLADVYDRLVGFMKREPQAAYHLIIGTDCQAHSQSTTFVTGIVLHRLGRGAWACYRKLTLGRAIRSIREKLSCETALSEEVVSRLGTANRQALEEIVLPHVYQGGSFEVFVDIDAGTNDTVNQTAPFAMEMVRRVEAMGVAARVKPEACVASGYANRYTKREGERLTGWGG